MALSQHEIQHIANLARLYLSAEDELHYASELSKILEFVAQMNAIDTSDIEPMAHPLDAVQRLRADVITETDQRDTLQALAPAVTDGLYTVPKVIE